MTLTNTKRVLFLTTHNPLDLSYGGGQRTHFIWKALQEVPGITVETVVPVPDMKMESYDEDGHIRRLCLERRYSIRWFLLRLSQRLFKRFMCPGLIALNRLYKYYPEGFDLVVVRYPGTASLYSAWKIAPMIIDVDDVPTQSFETNWNRGRGFYLKLCLENLRRWQNFIFSKAILLWVSNPENKDQMPQNIPVLTLSNIPRIDHPQYANLVSKEKYVFYLGCLAGQEKGVGIDYFLSCYWMSLHKRFPDLVFKIAGPLLDDEFKKRWGAYPNVEILGFVDDLDGLYRNARAMLAPIYAGAGTAIKVLECLSYGRVCIGSPFAWRGYDLNVEAAIEYNDYYQLEAALSKILDDQWLAVTQETAIKAVNKRFSQKTVNYVVTESLQNVFHYHLNDMVL